MTTKTFNTYFKLPIYYNPKKMKLKTNIITDLELIKNTGSDNECDISNNSRQSMYSHYFNSKTDLSKELIEQVSEYYTTDTKFLEDSQKILKKILAP